MAPWTRLSHQAALGSRGGGLLGPHRSSAMKSQALRHPHQPSQSGCPQAPAKLYVSGSHTGLGSPQNQAHPAPFSCSAFPGRWDDTTVVSSILALSTRSPAHTPCPAGVQTLTPPSPSHSHSMGLALPPQIVTHHCAKPRAWAWRQGPRLLGPRVQVTRGASCVSEW